MDPIIIKGMAEAPFPNTYSTALLDVIKVIDQHIPSMSMSNEGEINDLASRFGDVYEDCDAADLAIRTCHCGQKIDGFYEYVDHLKTKLTNTKETK